MGSNSRVRVERTCANTWPSLRATCRTASVLAIASAATFTSSADAALGSVRLESVIPGYEEIHFGTLDDFRGSTGLVTLDGSAHASYEMSSDRRHATFEFGHSRTPPRFGIPQTEVALLIEPERDLLFSVSGGYALKDDAVASHTSFSLATKILPVVDGYFETGRDASFLHTVDSHFSLFDGAPGSDQSAGVSMVEFGPNVPGEISLGTLVGTTFGVLEAGRVYGFFIESFLQPFSRDGIRVPSEGRGAVMISLVPVPEPGSALLLGLGLAGLGYARGFSGSIRRARVRADSARRSFNLAERQ